jgi:hypothetical protein
VVQRHAETKGVPSAGQRQTLGNGHTSEAISSIPRGCADTERAEEARGAEHMGYLEVLERLPGKEAMPLRDGYAEGRQGLR